MNGSFWRFGRIATGALLTFLLTDIPATAADDEALPFQLQVKKEEFEKKLRSGLGTVLSQYGTALDTLSQRKFTAQAEAGLKEVAKEKEWVQKLQKEAGQSTPLEFIATHLKRLNREEVELDAYLTESTWKLDNGETLTFFHDGGFAIDGKRRDDFGWQVADGDTFIYGAGFWIAEVRDAKRRFTAVTKHSPRKKRQGTFVDSVQYNGTPVPLMVRERAKMKVQLGTGLKALLQAYATPLDQTRKSQLQAGNLDAALATKHEWERLYEATELLFGDEFRIGDPTEAIKPLCPTPEALETALIDTVWRKTDGDAVRFRADSRAQNKPYSPFPFRTGWHVLDSRRIVYGHNYYVVRFDPKLTRFTAESRRRHYQMTAVAEEAK